MLVNFLKKGFIKLMPYLALDRFNLIRYNLYTDTGRQEARSIGISDAPTAYCNGDILHGVQSDYTIRKYLRKLLGQS